MIQLGTLSYTLVPRVGSEPVSELLQGHDVGVSNIMEPVNPSPPKPLTPARLESNFLSVMAAIGEEFETLPV